MGALAVFKSMDQLPDRAFIEVVGSGNVIMGRVGQAAATAMVAPCTNEWFTAQRTEWRRDARQSFMALRTDTELVGVGNARAADVTEGRDQEIKECLKELPRRYHT